jgi:hypothetical protein
LRAAIKRACVLIASELTETAHEATEREAVGEHEDAATRQSGRPLVMNPTKTHNPSELIEIEHALWHPQSARMRVLAW